MDDKNLDAVVRLDHLHEENHTALQLVNIRRASGCCINMEMLIIIYKHSKQAIVRPSKEYILIEWTSTFLSNEKPG